MKKVREFILLVFLFSEVLAPITQAQDGDFYENLEGDNKIIATENNISETKLSETTPSMSENNKQDKPQGTEGIEGNILPSVDGENNIETLNEEESFTVEKIEIKPITKNMKKAKSSQDSEDGIMLLAEGISDTTPYVIYNVNTDKCTFNDGETQAKVNFNNRGDRGLTSKNNRDLKNSNGNECPDNFIERNTKKDGSGISCGANKNFYYNGQQIKCNDGEYTGNFSQIIYLYAIYKPEFSTNIDDSQDDTEPGASNGEQTQGTGSTNPGTGSTNPGTGSTNSGSGNTTPTNPEIDPSMPIEDPIDFGDSPVVVVDANGGTFDIDKTTSYEATRESCYYLSEDKSKYYFVINSVTICRNYNPQYFYPVKDGKELNGFNDNFGNDYLPRSNFIDTDFESGGNRIYLYAQRKGEANKTQILVNFNTNGGVGVPSSIAVDMNSQIGTLPRPTREGYNFVGRFTDQDVIYDSNSTITESITLNAKRIEEGKDFNYTIVFDYNGGEESIVSKEVINSFPVGDLPETAKEGYNFEGWFMGTEDIEGNIQYGDEVLSGTIVDETFKDQILYAKRSPVKYTVIIGGESVDIEYGETYGELPIPEQEGYDFEGWFVGIEDEEGNIQYGAEITSGTVVDVTAENQKLYPKWTPTNYTVKLGDEDIEVKYGETYGELPTPQKEGYIFEGWFTQPEGGEHITSETTVTTSANNQILYPHWTKIPKAGYSGGGSKRGETISGTENDHNSADEKDINTEIIDTDISENENLEVNNENDMDPISMQEVVSFLKDLNLDDEVINNIILVDSSNEYNKNGKQYNKTGKLYSNEMKKAYGYSLLNRITTKRTIEESKLYSNLTRIQMAKMLSQYAINVLGMQPDTTKSHKFKDVSEKLDAEYDSGVTLAYQLGIMGQNMKNNKFLPKQEVTRAEFATALSRLLYQTPDNGRKDYYVPHIAKLYEEGVISNTEPTLKEYRGYVMIMLMRSDKTLSKDKVLGTID